MLIPGSRRSAFRWRYSNPTGPSTTPGTSVTPGASGAEGNWTSIATGANVAQDVYGLYIWITGGATSATSKMHLLDIGIDPAGGTSYTPIIENLQVGSAGTAAQGGVDIYLPYLIPAGSQIAVRVQGSAATAGTVRVACILYGLPSDPTQTHAYGRAETIGTITSTRGVVVTPGTSAAEGSWTSIGTTTFDWQYCIPTFQLDDSTATAQQIFFDVAYGDGTNFVILAENINASIVSSGEAAYVALASAMRDLWGYVPSGSTIYVRCSTSIATADSNYCFLVTGLG